MAISVLSNYEFPGRGELFELKDIIHNDSTNDPFKYFFNVQYFEFIVALIELKFINEL